MVTACASVVIAFVYRRKFTMESSFTSKLAAMFWTKKKIAVLLLLLAVVFLLHNFSVPSLGPSRITSFMRVREARVRPGTESKPDYGINTRRLVLLTTHRMNEIVQVGIRNLKRPTSCAKWWANPLDVRKNVIANSTTQYDDHDLEFVAVSNWEIVTFRSKVRVFVHQRPEGVEFLNDEFIRLDDTNDSGQKHACVLEEDKGSTATGWEWIRLCSCDQSSPPPRLTPRSTLNEWPVNVSFMVADYMNFDTQETLFSIIPPDPVCASSPLIVLVISAPAHFVHRKTIRETYGSPVSLGLGSINVSLFFVIGQVQTPGLQDSLNEEARTFNDIIQANFVDTYQNLTLKYLATLAYVYFACSEPKLAPNDKNETTSPLPLPFKRSSYNPPTHILKTDDDFFLNVDVALQVAAANPGVELMGSRVCGGAPIRDQRSKWWLPDYIYTGDKFPSIIFGGTSLMRSDVIPTYLQAALTTPLLNLEDVYAGVLSRAVGIQQRHSAHFGNHATHKEPVGSEARFRQLETMVNAHVDSVEELRTTWEFWSSKREAAANDDGQQQQEKRKGKPEDFKVEALTDHVKKVCDFK